MPTTTSTDRIEKTAVLKAPRSRVWRGLTNAQEFGTWFRAVFTEEFREGAVVRAKITYPGYEHLTLEFRVVRMEPERYFAFRWHPNEVDLTKDYSAEPTTPPSTRNSTRATPPASETSAEMETTWDTRAPGAGEVMAAWGGVVSAGPPPMAVFMSITISPALRARS